MLATLFYNPVSLRSDQLLWLILPLCASLAVLYKTIRTNDLSRLPREILVLFGYILMGLVGMGAGIWLITKCLA